MARCGTANSVVNVRIRTVNAMNQTNRLAWESRNASGGWKIR